MKINVCLRAAIVPMLLFALTPVSVKAGEPDTPPTAVKAVFSVSTAWIHDAAAGSGIAVRVGTESYFGGSDFYWGITSAFGSFIPAGTAMFETGAAFGYTAVIPAAGFGIDLAVSLILTGGRIDAATMKFRPEAPAVQPSIGIMFPEWGDVGIGLAFAPVIRPYDIVAGTWDFSRSYLDVSIVVESRSFMTARQGRWADRNGGMR